MSLRLLLILILCFVFTHQDIFIADPQPECMQYCQGNCFSLLGQYMHFIYFLALEIGCSGIQPDEKVSLDKNRHDFSLRIVET